MIPPKYNFYVGKLDRSIYPLSHTGINDSGEFVYESGKYAYDLSSLDKNKLIFVNLVSVNSYNAVFFYDSSMSFISYKALVNNDAVIIPPSNAKYCAFRFTGADINFMAKKDTNFIYFIESVKPHYKELNKKYAKENGQEFFRVSLDGKINLFGNGYELVYNSDLEDQMIFIIDKYNTVSGKWLEYYKGEFNKTDCKFDYEKKSCELKTTVLDEYNDIINKYENTYDLIKLAPAITKINSHKRSLTQIYIKGANSISNFFGGTYWESDVNEAVDSGADLINKYYFAYIKAGNEFYIKSAGISDVNGVYAGTNGYWSKWNPGYTCKMELENGSSTMYWVRLYRNSDNVLLYQSEHTWTVLDHNNKYISSEVDNIKMVNVNNQNDTFIIEDIFVYHIYKRLLCDVDTVTDSEEIKNTYDLPIDDFVTDNRNYKKCIGLGGGMFFCTSRAIDEPTKYGLNDYGQYFTNQFIPNSTNIGRPLPIGKNLWANASLWYVYDSYYEHFEKKLRKEYTLKDSYSIAAVIKVLLGKIDPTLNHEATAEYSRFLYDTNAPISMARFYVFITQKTNILKGDYDQPAQKAETSLAEITKMLRDCFRCYWYIEDGKFKIEHISFFMNGGSYSTNASIQLDFTKLTDQFNKKLLSYFQSELEYDKTDLAQRYEFTWMDDATELFGGVALDVKSNYVQKDKKEEINANQFSADVDYMLFNPSAFSDDGFALLCPIHSYKYIKDLSYTQSTETSILSETIEVNGGVTIEPIDSDFIITVQAFKSNGNPLPVPEQITEPLKFTSVATLSITLRLASGNNLTPSDLSQMLLTKIGKITFNDRLELPIISTSLKDENGDSYTAIIQNWYASWIYLTSTFYTYDMPAFSLQSSAIGELYANSIKKCMKNTIEFPAKEDLNELQLVKTGLGNGKIDEFSVNLETRQIKAKLAYSPK